MGTSYRDVAVKPGDGAAPVNYGPAAGLAHQWAPECSGNPNEACVSVVELTVRGAHPDVSGGVMPVTVTPTAKSADGGLDRHAACLTVRQHVGGCPAGRRSNEDGGEGPTSPRSSGRTVCCCLVRTPTGRLRNPTVDHSLGMSSPGAVGSRGRPSHPAGSCSAMDLGPGSWITGFAVGPGRGLANWLIQKELPDRAGTSLDVWMIGMGNYALGGIGCASMLRAEV